MVRRKRKNSESDSDYGPGEDDEGPYTPSTYVSQSQLGSPASPSKKASLPIANYNQATWRPSYLTKRDTLITSDGQKRYHLNASDTRTISPCETGTNRFGYDYRVYYEKDMERLAWEKHGGPDRFEALLDYWEEQYLAKHPGRIFEGRPKNRGIPSPSKLAKHAHSTPTTPASSPVKASSTPQRHAIRASFPQPWIWQVCEKLAWNPDPAVLWDRLDCAYSKSRSADRMLPMVYPARPSPKDRLPSSSSLKVLRTLLRDAPSRTSPYATATNGDVLIEQDFEVQKDDDGTEYRVWSPAFLERLHDALIGVIQEHGLEGWSRVRWEVYEAHGVKLGNIVWLESSRAWMDEGFHFLQGQRDLSTREADWRLGENGKQYNGLLPKVAQGDGCQHYWAA